MNWKEMVNTIELAQKIELPYFCFDPEFVNLAEVYAQLMFAAKCACVSQDQFADDLCGCLDSGLL